MLNSPGRRASRSHRPKHLGSNFAARCHLCVCCHRLVHSGLLRRISCPPHKLGGNTLSMDAACCGASDARRTRADKPTVAPDRPSGSPRRGPWRLVRTFDLSDGIAGLVTYSIKGDRSSRSDSVRSLPIRRSVTGRSQWGRSVRDLTPLAWGVKGEAWGGDREAWAEMKTKLAEQEKEPERSQFTIANNLC